MSPAGGDEMFRRSRRSLGKPVAWRILRFPSRTRRGKHCAMLVGEKQRVSYLCTCCTVRIRRSDDELNDGGDNYAGQYHDNEPFERTEKHNQISLRLLEPRAELTHVEP